jgi:hypothetical protein
VYDSRDDSSETGPSPSPPFLVHRCTKVHRFSQPYLFNLPSLLTHVHRYIGSLNPTCQTLPNSVRLTYLGVYDSRDDSSETGPSPSPPFLAHACTQVYRFSQPYLTVPLPCSHMYTGTSVLATLPVRRCPTP